jgi:hypothetical protein
LSGYKKGPRPPIFGPVYSSDSPRQPSLRRFRLHVSGTGVMNVWTAKHVVAKEKPSMSNVAIDAEKTPTADAAEPTRNEAEGRESREGPYSRPFMVATGMPAYMITHFSGGPLFSPLPPQCEKNARDQNNTDSHVQRHANLLFGSIMARTHALRRFWVATSAGVPLGGGFLSFVLRPAFLGRFDNALPARSAQLAFLGYGLLRRCLNRFPRGCIPLLLSFRHSCSCCGTEPSSLAGRS